MVFVTVLSLITVIPGTKNLHTIELPWDDEATPNDILELLGIPQHPHSFHFGYEYGPIWYVDANRISSEKEMQTPLCDLAPNFQNKRRHYLNMVGQQNTAYWLDGNKWAEAYIGG